jgi:uncharacterized protein (DUF488 family)
VSAVAGPNRDSTDTPGRAVIWTIGHGTRRTDELAALLQAAGVSRLIDVRRYPAGRRQPHLSRERLEADLPALGLGYEWWGDALGGRRPAPDPSLPPSRWRSPAFAAYEAYSRTPPFRDAIRALELRVTTGDSLALMCAETLWWRCHRRLIADALVADGLVVRHLLDRPPGAIHHESGPGRPAPGSDRPPPDRDQLVGVPTPAQERRRPHGQAT